MSSLVRRCSITGHSGCCGSRVCKNWAHISVRFVHWSLPGRCNDNSVISKHMWRNKLVSTAYEITLTYMPQNTFDDKSTLVRLMALKRPTNGHFRSQCSRSSVSPYVFTLPQGVKIGMLWNINPWYTRQKISTHVQNAMSVFSQNIHSKASIEN